LHAFFGISLTFPTTRARGFGQLEKRIFRCEQDTSRVILTYHLPQSVESSKSSPQIYDGAPGPTHVLVAHARSRALPLLTPVLDCVKPTPGISFLRYKGTINTMCNRN